MKYSLVTIAPAEYRDAINMVAESHGYGPDNLSVPLSADGKEPATHYGMRAWADSRFRHGYETLFPRQLLDACVIDWRFHDPNTIRLHFPEVAAAHNLQRIEDAQNIQEG